MKFKINDNIKHFLIRVVILIGIIFFSRVLFQFPVEYFKLSVFSQSALTRLFSKIDALQITAFMSIFFGFYYRERIKKINHPKIDLKKSILFLIAAELTIAAYYLIRASANYFNITGGLRLYLIQFGLIISLALAFLLFVVAVFRISYMKKFFYEFKKELIVFAIISIIFYALLMWFQKQWYFFSSGISKILAWILSLFFNVYYAMIDSTPVVGVRGFNIAIGPPCSGVDSMLLFVAFAAAVFALDNKRLKKGWYLLSSIIGLIGIYFVNVLRLFLLVLAGVYISPNFAVGLFHTNAGWLLFVLYFFAYYLIIRKFIYTKSQDTKEKRLK